MSRMQFTSLDYNLQELNATYWSKMQPVQLTGVKCNHVMSLTEVAATFWRRKQPTVVKYNLKEFTINYKQTKNR